MLNHDFMVEVTLIDDFCVNVISVCVYIDLFFFIGYCSTNLNFSFEGVLVHRSLNFVNIKTSMYSHINYKIYYFET